MTEFQRRQLLLAIALASAYCIYLAADGIGRARERKARCEMFRHAQQTNERWMEYVKEEAIGRRVDEI